MKEGRIGDLFCGTFANDVVRVTWHCCHVLTQVSGATLNTPTN